MKTPDYCPKCGSKKQKNSSKYTCGSHLSVSGKGFWETEVCKKRRVQRQVAMLSERLRHLEIRIRDAQANIKNTFNDKGLDN